MNVLVDTHLLLWLLSDAGQGRVPGPVRARFEAASTRFVSAASVYEIGYKGHLGRLAGGAAVLDAWSTVLSNLRLVELPLQAVHMARAGTLAWDHRDPFDRMLVAQAQLDGLELLTADERIRSFGDVVSWWA